MKKTSLALILISLLSACASEPPVSAPKLDYALPPKINLDVQHLDLVDRSTTPFANSPMAINHFQPTVAEAIQQWAADRLQASGSAGDGQVIIRDASLTSQALPIDHSISGWFSRQQSSKYVAHAEVEIDLKGQQGFAMATAQATRYETLPEDPTDAEKQKAYFDVLNVLMRDLGRNLEASINQHMQNFMITAPVMKNGMGSEQ